MCVCVSLRTQCERVLRQVFSAGPNGNVNWPWSGELVLGVKKWETKSLRMTSRPKDKMVEFRKRTSRDVRATWKER